MEPWKELTLAALPVVIKAAHARGARADPTGNNLC